MNKRRENYYQNKWEANRQQQVRAAMLIVSARIKTLREIERLLSLASSDKIPCEWVDPILAEARRAGVAEYLQLGYGHLRRILCGRDEVK